MRIIAVRRHSFHVAPNISVIDLRALTEGFLSDLPLICYLLLSVWFSWRFLKVQELGEKTRRTERQTLLQIEQSLAALNHRLDRIDPSSASDRSESNRRLTGRAAGAG